MFIDGMSADGLITRMNYAIYKTILSAPIQSNAAKLIELHLTVQMAKATQELEMFFNVQVNQPT